MKPVFVRRHQRRTSIPAYHTVMSDTPEKELLSMRERERLGVYCGETHLFGIDQLIGDDEYVFLSVGKPYKTEVGTTQCLVFDAEELIRRGALVRTADILTTAASYVLDQRLEEAQVRASEEFNTLVNRGQRTSEEDRRLDELRENLGDEFSVDEVNPRAMSKESVAWYIKSYPPVAEAWRMLERVRKDKTLSGQAALKALHDGSAVEVLVPKRLPFTPMSLSTVGEVD